jgi:hypothetical protein
MPACKHVATQMIAYLSTMPTPTTALWCSDCGAIAIRAYGKAVPWQLPLNALQKQRKRKTNSSNG